MSRAMVRSRGRTDTTPVSSIRASDGNRGGPGDEPVGAGVPSTGSMGAPPSLPNCRCSTLAYTPPPESSSRSPRRPSTSWSAGTPWMRKLIEATVSRRSVASRLASTAVTVTPPARAVQPSSRRLAPGSGAVVVVAGARLAAGAGGRCCAQPRTPGRPRPPWPRPGRFAASTAAVGPGPSRAAAARAGGRRGRRRRPPGWPAGWRRPGRRSRPGGRRRSGGTRRASATRLADDPGAADDLLGLGPDDRRAWARRRRRSG